MLSYTKLTPASKKFLAWKWCLSEDHEKKINEERCNFLYKEYINEVTKKNKKNTN